MGRVLQTLGGVAPEDIVFVSTANRAAFDAAFADVEQRLRAGATPGVRRELMVYYSGHSDEDGLLVGRDRVGYDELRARVQRAPADLRVVILDSCASGAFTRRKGGVKRAPFLMDASIDMRGHAFLTSSAADERAQESDRIAASYFTYYLVSGLRGAADMNSDKRVTLQEAYQFASQETLARTERSQAGPQHAAYEFDLAGTGDMVVTDVRGTQSGLVLTPELGGRITVREANGALVAELRKPAGNTIELGLEPGAYVVAMDSGTTVFQANVALTAGKHTPLAAASFHPAGPRETTVARGDNAPAPDAPATGEPAATATATPSPEQEPTSFKLILFPRASDAHADVHGFSFGFVADRSRRVHGLQLALGWAQTDQDLVALQLAVGGNLVQGKFEGAQIAAGINIVRGTGRGLQLVGGGNIVDGSYEGAQIAGGINTVSDKMKGLQMAGGANWVGEGRGLQMAGGVNLAQRFTGLQMAPVNYAGTMDGFQFGVVNASTAANGFRFGVVNATGTSRGFQLGVVNVAKHDDGESFALINVIGNGIHDVSLFATDVMLTNVGFKLGGRHLYTHLMAGYQPGDELPAGTETFSADTRRFATGVGVGWRFPVERGVLSFLELEGDWLQVRPVWKWTEDAPAMGSLRLQAGLRIAPHLALLAGAGVNVAVATDGRDLDLGLDVAQGVYHSGRTTVRIYPGLLLGLQI